MTPTKDLNGNGIVCERTEGPAGSHELQRTMTFDDFVPVETLPAQPPEP